VKVVFHDDALAEYVDAVAWYERDYRGRGERFAAAVERVLLPAPDGFHSATGRCCGAAGHAAQGHVEPSRAFGHLRGGRERLRR